MLFEPVPVLPVPPDSNDNATFDARADSFFSALPAAVDGVNRFIESVEAHIRATYGGGGCGVTATSATSASIGSGTFVLHIDSGKPIVPGQHVCVWSPTGQAGALCRVVSHVQEGGGDFGVLTLTVLETVGSGTHADWSIFVVSPIASDAGFTTLPMTAQGVRRQLRDTHGVFADTVLPVYNLFAPDLALPSSTTFTRASSATRVNAAGRVESEATDVPRFDFDPATGELLGLRIEGAATNLVTYAGQVDNAAWLKTGGSVTADAGTAPAGGATADTFVENTETNTHFLSLPSVSSTAGVTYAVSTYLRSAGKARCQTSLPPTRFGTTNMVAFWLDTGAYEIFAGTPAVFVQEFVDSWWRVASVAQVTSGVSGPAGYVWNVNASGSTSYTGDGSSGLYVWGAQAEANAFPTSYIPTTTATATRAADVCTAALSGLDAFNVREGALYVAARTPLGVGAAVQVLAQIDDGSESNRIRVERDTSRHLRCIVTASGAEQASLDLGAVDDDTDFRVSFAWAANSFAATLDAGTDVTDAAGSVPTGLTTLRLGQSYTGEHWHGTIKHLALFPAALTTAQRLAMAR